MEVGRRRIVRAAPDRKASQSPHSASFFPFPSLTGFASFASLLPPPPPPSMKGCLLVPSCSTIYKPEESSYLLTTSCMNELKLGYKNRFLAISFRVSFLRSFRNVIKINFLTTFFPQKCFLQILF